MAVCGRGICFLELALVVATDVRVYRWFGVGRGC